jgi:arginase family enzyme
MARSSVDLYYFQGLISAAVMDASEVHLDLDNAWCEIADDLPRIDATKWGPRLRFSTSPRAVEQFYREVSPHLGKFVLYGSGDFHHLTALWLRQTHEPITLVSFDNHPDWDVRPPRWCCGGWVNRALELPHVRQAAVWGCGNFECWWPHQIFGNRKAERAGTLTVHPWADDRPPSAQERRGAILRENWREQFEKFASELIGSNIYITIDLDCLAADYACVNWESGKFDLDDVRWGLEMLRKHAHILGGDICGAYSAPIYARRKQRFAANWDHPEINLPPSETIRATNRRAFEALWPALAH